MKNVTSTRLLIAKKGWTLRTLALEIGVSHSYLSQVLGGKKNPSATFAKKLSKGINESIEDIFLVKVVDEQPIGGGKYDSCTSNG